MSFYNKNQRQGQDGRFNQNRFGGGGFDKRGGGGGGFDKRGGGGGMKGRFMKEKEVPKELEDFSTINKDSVGAGEDWGGDGMEEEVNLKERSNNIAQQEAVSSNNQKATKSKDPRLKNNAEIPTTTLNKLFSGSESTGKQATSWENDDKIAQIENFNGMKNKADEEKDDWGLKKKHSDSKEKNQKKQDDNDTWDERIKEEGSWDARPKENETPKNTLREEYSWDSRPKENEKKGSLIEEGSWDERPKENEAQNGSMMRDEGSWDERPKENEVQNGSMMRDEGSWDERPKEKETQNSSIMREENSWGERPKEKASLRDESSWDERPRENGSQKKASLKDEGSWDERPKENGSQKKASLKDEGSWDERPKENGSQKKASLKDEGSWDERPKEKQKVKEENSWDLNDWGKKDKSSENLNEPPELGEWETRDSAEKPKNSGDNWNTRDKSQEDRGNNNHNRHHKKHDSHEKSSEKQMTALELELNKKFLGKGKEKSRSRSKQKSRNDNKDDAKNRDWGIPDSRSVSRQQENRAGSNSSRSNNSSHALSSKISNTFKRESPSNGKFTKNYGKERDFNNNDRNFPMKSMKEENISPSPYNNRRESADSGNQGNQILKVQPTSQNINSLIEMTLKGQKVEFITNETTPQNQEDRWSRRQEEEWGVPSTKDTSFKRGNDWGMPSSQNNVSKNDNDWGVPTTSQIKKENDWDQKNRKTNEYKSNNNDSSINQWKGNDNNNSQWKGNDNNNNLWKGNDNNHNQWKNNNNNNGNNNHNTYNHNMRQNSFDGDNFNHRQDNNNNGYRKKYQGGNSWGGEPNEKEQPFMHAIKVNTIQKSGKPLAQEIVIDDEDDQGTSQFKSQDFDERLKGPSNIANRLLLNEKPKKEAIDSKNQLEQHKSNPTVNKGDQSPVYEPDTKSFSRKQNILFNPDDLTDWTMPSPTYVPEPAEEKTQDTTGQVGVHDPLSLENIYDFKDDMEVEDNKYQSKKFKDSVVFYTQSQLQSSDPIYLKEQEFFEKELLHSLYPHKDNKDNCFLTYEGKLYMKKQIQNISEVISAKVMAFSNHPWNQLQIIPSLKQTVQSNKMREFKTIDFSMMAATFKKMIKRDHYDNIFYLLWLEGATNEERIKIESFADYLYSNHMAAGINMENYCFTMAHIQQIFPSVQQFKRPNSSYPVKLVIIANLEVIFQIGHRLVPY